MSLAPYTPDAAQQSTTTGGNSSNSNTATPTNSGSSPQLRHSSPTARSKSSSTSSTHSSASHSSATAGGIPKISVLPAAQLVCLIELGLFEISLRLNDRPTTRAPKFDLRATVNALHLRTCADSAEALGQLIGYLATGGDLSAATAADDDDSGMGSDVTNGSGAGLPTSTQPADALISTADAPPTATAAVLVTPAQQQRVATLMEEAMQESIRVVEAAAAADKATAAAAAAAAAASLTDATSSDDDHEVFFFPDEAAQLAAERRAKAARPKQRCQSTCLPNKTCDPANDQATAACSSSSGAHDCGRTSTAADKRLSINTLMNFEASQMPAIVLDENEDDGDDELLVEENPQVVDELGNAAPAAPVRRPQPPPTTTTTTTPKSRRISANDDTDDEFCIIGDEERPRCGFETVPVASPSDPICIVDNHFSVPAGRADLLQAPADFPMAVTRYTLCELTLTWHLFGGQDFETTPAHGGRYTSRPTSQASSAHHSAHVTAATVQATTHRMSDTYRMGVSYAKGSPNTVSFNAMPSSPSSPQPPAPPTETAARLWKKRGGPHRRIDVLIEAHIGRMRFSHEKYSLTAAQASRQVLLVRRLEIRDRMACSQIKKFLYLPDEELDKDASSTGAQTGGPQTAAGPRHMLVVKALHVRPEPLLHGGSECSLMVSMLPLRLHIDQDALLFLVEFFACLGNGGTVPAAAASAASQGGRVVVQPGQRRRRSSSGGGSAGNGGSYHAAPVMMVDEMAPAEQAQQARRMLRENLDLLIDEDGGGFYDDDRRAADAEATAAAAAEEEAAEGRAAAAAAVDDEAPIYFRTIVFSPAVLITLDYHGKRVEMSQGPLTGLIMGLGQLQCTEIRLREIHYR